MNRLLIALLLAVGFTTASAATSGPSYACEAKFFTMSSNGQQIARSDYRSRTDNLTVNERSVYFRENAGKTPGYEKFNFATAAATTVPGVTNEMYITADRRQAIMLPSVAHDSGNRKGFVVVTQSDDASAQITSSYFCRPE